MKREGTSSRVRERKDERWVVGGQWGTVPKTGAVSVDTGKTEWQLPTSPSACGWLLWGKVEVREPWGAGIVAARGWGAPGPCRRRGQVCLNDSQAGGDADPLLTAKQALCPVSVIGGWRGGACLTDRPYLRGGGRLSAGPTEAPPPPAYRTSSHSVW